MNLTPDEAPSSTPHAATTLKHLPPVGKPVIVRNDKFSCAGYLDITGTWRSWHSKAPIPGPIIGWEMLQRIGG